MNNIPILVIVSIILFMLFMFYLFPSIKKYLITWKFKRNKYDKSTQIRLIHQVTEAVTEMSQKKIGALITIEKNNSLDGLRTDGIIIDANISSQLLISIFQKKSPLHDGGVIVSNNKIKYASTYYKITNGSVSNKYGARHRAALGISEASDSLTIVVSEETGGIVFVQKGKLLELDVKNLQSELSKKI